MSIYYTTSEEIENGDFSEEQNIVNIDNLPLEEREFVKQLIDYIPEF